MTIPNVTMKWCVKKSTCKWCEQPIDNGTPVVTVFFWNKGNEDSRKWNTKYSYHPQCWVAQGLDYLNRNPYVPQTRRKKPTLCEEDRRTRFLLVRKFHKAEQVRNINRDGGSYPDKLLAEIRLTQQMVDIMLEVATVGGVPKSWAERL